MNLSGESIKEAVEFYKIKQEKLIVIYDDIDVDPGYIKIRKTGGAGTHNGMKSVIQNIDTTDFIRIRVGIGQPKFKSDLINYVLGFIPEEEKEVLDKSTTKAGAIIKHFDIVDFDEIRGIVPDTVDFGNYLDRLRDLTFSPQTMG